MVFTRLIRFCMAQFQRVHRSGVTPDQYSMCCDDEVSQPSHPTELAITLLKSPLTRCLAHLNLEPIQVPGEAVFKQFVEVRCDVLVYLRQQREAPSSE